MNNNNSLTAFVLAFVDELIKVNVTDVVISPGSRSTPMAMIMAEHPMMNVYVNIDERSAAFFALGIAKSKRKPVAILCTSGTAAANYMPAIVEAYYSRVPLIVLTADRPHELRDIGAPQAINQIGLFGEYTKWFAEMAIPEDTPEMLNYVRTFASRASGTAMQAPKGPVHLNFPFREPLVPLMEAIEHHDQGSYVNVTIGAPSLTTNQYDSIHDRIAAKKKGLIICGAIDDPSFAEAVIELAAKLQYPIFADPLSQLRSGHHNKELIIDSYDTILRNKQILQLYKPEVIIRFGEMPVSKALTLYIKQLDHIDHLVIDGGGGWREPTLSASDMIHCDEVNFCSGLSDVIKELNNKSHWVTQWIEMNAMIKSIWNGLEYEEDLFEGKVFSELTKTLPYNTTLFVGNSMPIRDLDSFFLTNDKSIRVLANRGANGIDGIVSTALGASINCSPLVLVIGDLSFYHDLNGLLAAKMHKLNMTIIVINNDGGGIFSFLPQAQHQNHFETLFGTPLGLDYEYVVNMYGGEFNRVTKWNDFREKVQQSIHTDGLSVIELTTDRTTNVEMHRSLWNMAVAEIDAFLGVDHEN
ncbi:2-succinyl-5-enolpyruvyl-6-hydroxy-3-cyclohexene-1-carboxylic-acid synthase [Bacillus sp. SCS-151]|uniref:2-succinyl-5-enolpyruvyl-6-hydroxy-3- cyclohexene-1-carboxylic-acid synthase n=1 Tax=Nanhaiella sioensis TaxID=3115293 RepID=UPI0039784217